MSKTIIALLFIFTPVMAATLQKPEYATKTLAAFYKDAKNQSGKKELWASYTELVANLKSEKIVINNQSQLIYMNSLLLALDEISEKEVLASKCNDMSMRLDKRFLTPGVSFANSPQHYQDAKNILESICK